MKSIFYYTLPLVLTTSSLVAGPKRIIPDDKKSTEPPTDIARRDSDTSSAAGGSSLSGRSTDAPNIAERKLSSSEPITFSDESATHTHSISQADNSITQLQTQDTTAIKKAQDRFASAQNVLREKSAIVANFAEIANITNPNSNLGLLTSCLSQTVSSLLNPAIAKAIEESERAAKELEQAKAAAPKLPLDIPHDQITAVGKITIFSDPEQNPQLVQKEEIPLISSVFFGTTRRSEIAADEQQDLVRMLHQTETNPFSEMQRDLARASFDLTDDRAVTISFPVISDPSGEIAKKRLDTILSLIGTNRFLQIAITNLMYQKGAARLETLQYNLLQEEPAIPTENASNSWKLNLDGPLAILLADSERSQKIEIPTYHLEKSIIDGKPIFRLTIKLTRTNQFRDLNIDHLLTCFLTYEFHENNSYNPASAISQENLPIIIRCSDGGIIRKFDDKRISEQLDLQEAEYNLALAKVCNTEVALKTLQRNLAAARYNYALCQKQLEILGDPEKIEAEYQQKIQFLASRAASRPGAIMNEDCKAAKAKLQQLKKAKQALTIAEEQVTNLEEGLSKFSKRIDS